MGHPLFFMCPNCFSEDSIHKSSCEVCGTAVKIHHNSIYFGGKCFESWQYYLLLKEKLVLPQLPLRRSHLLNHIPSIDSLPLRISGRCMLRQGRKPFQFEGYHGLFRQRLEFPENLARGYLIMYPEQVVFLSGREMRTWPIESFTCVTTNGHYFEFKVHHEPYYQLRFISESPLKYEILFRKWLQKYYQNQDAPQIIEFQPRLRFGEVRSPGGLWKIGKVQARELPGRLEKIFFNGVQKLVRGLFKIWIQVKVRGLENWRRQEQGFVLVNHQSALDPFIIGAFLDREIAFLTKSTSFSHFLPRIFLKWVMGLPTTRYQNDPSIIRTSKIMLERGIKVGIFPEGERCWGGLRRPFKLGTIKLLLASRQAIFPLIIANAFHFWPRWSRWPRQAQISIRVMPPFCLIPDLYSVNEQKLFLESYFDTHIQENTAEPAVSEHQFV